MGSEPDGLEERFDSDKLTWFVLTNRKDFDRFRLISHGESKLESQWLIEFAWVSYCGINI